VCCKFKETARRVICDKESNVEGNFLSLKERSELSQEAYKEVIKCKSKKLHGNGYLAKNPTRRQLLNADHEEQIRREEQQHWEHLELMEEFKRLQEQMNSWEADRAAERQAQRAFYAAQIEEVMRAREADK